MTDSIKQDWIEHASFMARDMTTKQLGQAVVNTYRQSKMLQTKEELVQELTEMYMDIVHEYVTKTSWNDLIDMFSTNLALIEAGPKEE